MSYFSRCFIFLLGLGALIAACPVRADDAHETQAPAKEAPAFIPESDAPLDIPPMAPMKPVAPDVSMGAFGTANPDCMEWTDGCSSCLRDIQNSVACSTPGIACLPRDMSCETKRGK